MENVSIIVSIASGIISLFALSFSIFTYFRHEKKIKDAQYRQLQHEEDENKKALISANIVKSLTKGNRILKIYNKGKSKAINVRVELVNNIDEIQFYNWRGSFSMLSPGQGHDITFLLLAGSFNDEMHLRFTWEDDYCKERSNEEFLPIE